MDQHYLHQQVFHESSVGFTVTQEWNKKTFSCLALRTNNFFHEKKSGRKVPSVLLDLHSEAATGGVL